MAATSFPRWRGDGQGAFVWGLAQALVRKGVAVQVLALHVPGAAVQEQIEGVRIWRPRYWWPERFESLRKDGGGLPITLRKYPLARVQLAPMLAVWAAALAHLARGCDLIHAHWTLAAAAGLLGRRIHHRPLVVTVQGSDIFQVPKLPGGSWFTRQILTKADRVTALSRALVEASAKLGVAADHIQIIPNGVDVGRFIPKAEAVGGDPQPSEKIILFVGSLITRKGATYLLDALPAVLQAEPSARLVLIGDGPEEERLRQQAERLGVARRVAFLGFLPQDEVGAWLQQAQLFVLPSLEEGQGVVILEALAAGLPVIASRVGGIPEVITADVGILTPPGEAAPLAQALVELLADPQRCRAMGRCARQYVVAHYDWAVIADEYIALYRSLLGNG